MQRSDLEKTLQDLPLGGLRYYPTIGSTNDEALAWAAGNASDFSLVLADAQTNGRGRAGRQWLSQPDASLTFSLILKPPAGQQADLPRYAFLGALALTRVLTTSYNLPAKIKWPNDVLIDGKKVCGILAEVVWTGADVDSVVLGIGVNLLNNAYPAGLALNFPAGSLQQFLPNPPSRLQLLRQLLLQIKTLQATITTPEFLQQVRSHLAYLDQMVVVVSENEPAQRVFIKGLGDDGSLRVADVEQGVERTLHQGEVHLLAGV